MSVLQVNQCISVKKVCCVGSPEIALTVIIFSAVSFHKCLTEVWVYTTGVKITRVNRIFSVFTIAAFIRVY
jgi:hypothetical protein